MTIKSRRVDFVLVRRPFSDAFGLDPRVGFPTGAWIITEAGELHVESSGAVTLRPTPLPWSRPSIAAVPSKGRP
jgi:hypothetical protein